MSRSAKNLDTQNITPNTISTDTTAYTPRLQNITSDNVTIGTSTTASVPWFSSDISMVPVVGRSSQSVCRIHGPVEAMMFSDMGIDICRECLAEVHRELAATLVTDIEILGEEEDARK